jgi:DNA-binding response OmpR family regulator
MRGEEVKLTPTEYSILKILARDSGRVITHGRIRRSSGD